MLIGRLLGLVFLSSAFVLGGIEILRLLQSTTFQFIDLMDIWQATLGTASLDQFSKMIHNSPFPGMWEDVFIPMLALPAVITLLVIGSAFVLINRREAF